MGAGYQSPPPPASRTDARLTAFWALLTIAALGYVAAFGHDFPWADEWEFVPALYGHEPTGPWLWTQHNEHRLPLPRAIYWLLFQVTHDFRGGMVLQVALLSAVALRLMRFARRERGHAAWPDAVFPALLLNWGHAENFLMGYQLCFALVTALTVELFVAARTGHTRRVLPLTLLLELCGGAGLVFVPIVLAWRVAVGSWAERALWLLPLAYLGVYFVDYARPPHHPPPSDPLLAVVVAAQVLAMSVGYAAAWVWPAVAVALVILGVATLRHAPSLGERVVIVAGGAVACAVGVGRSGFGNFEMGLWSRYGMLTAPLLAMAYLTFADRPRVQKGIAATVLVLLPFNTAVGVGWGVTLDRTLMPVVAAHRAGVAPAEIVRDHLTGSGQEERALRGLPMLGKR